ncbi:MAG: ABC transporter permease [Candidatus Eisenbacteria bacterium]|nr:ABC transporter permease [Candidatus Eisenbacteria bacterium]
MGPGRQGLALMVRFLGRGRSRPAAILLAVGWGTLAMMLLLAFGEGLKLTMETGRYGLGLDPVIVWAGTTTKPWMGMKAGRGIDLNEEDLAALEREIPEIDEVAGERQRWAVDITWGSKAVSTHLTGVMPCYEGIRTHHPQRGGRFLNETDQAQGRRVIFLGPDLKERLFGPEAAVGQSVQIHGVPFTVVGVMIDKQQMGMYSGPDVNKASIPLSTFESVFGKTEYSLMLYTIKPDADSKEVEKKVREVFARRQRFDREDESALHFWDTIENRKETAKVMNGMQIFLGLVGGMTILVAGVGLANMLFVMVHRRTREIGMQMAIGARKAAITSQVVGESLILAGIGGYLGIGLSWLVVELLQRIPIKNEGLQFLGKPTLSLPLGIVTVAVLVGIGCLAGALPSRRAARLNPVEALRHE